MKIDISPSHVAVCSRARLFAERRLQVAKHAAALGPIAGRAVHSDAPRDLLVAGTGVSSQQNLRAFELARRMPPLRSALSSLRSVWPSSTIEYTSSVPPAPWRRGRTNESDGPSESFRKTLRPNQGASIHVCTPACIAGAAGGSRHPAIFCLTPPFVHQMVLTIERAGFIRRGASLAVLKSSLIPNSCQSYVV
jgi:hypothetical protein